MLIREYLVSTWFVTLIASVSSAAVITVGPTGKYDFQTIQEAVNASVDGDEIIVAPGVYTSNSWTPVVVMDNKNIWLHSSDGPETTFLDGGQQNKTVVQLYYGESNIQGFMIQNGSASGGGGGMRLYYASPTIANCIFENNNNDGGGGGGYRGSYTYGGGAILNEGGSPTITGCVFRGNRASGNGGAIYNKYSSNSWIQDCLFETNSAEKGGAICNSSSSSCNVTMCSFQQNNATFYGGAIYLLENCEVTISESNIENNNSDLGGGGIYNQGGILAVTDCSFNQNVALPGNGGGISILGGGDATVNSSEFTNNAAVGGGGVFVSTSSMLDLGNSMFCENAGGNLLGDFNDLGGNEFNNSCSTTDGACCTNNICVVIDAVTCAFVGGDYQGLKSTCSEELCPLTCLGDITGDGQVNISDLLVIISVWGTCP